jgi:hypothetical protein
MIRLAFLLGTMALTQGCAAIPVAVAVGAMGVMPGDPAPRAVDSRVGTVVTAGAAAPAPAPRGLPRLGPLPAQTLSPGDCALFLFSRAEPSRFVAFAAADGESLILTLDGGVERLPAAAPFVAAGNAFEQIYRADDGLEARLTATLGEPLPQGRRAPEAALRLVSPDGAAQVTPLAGLVACEAR